MPIDSRSPHPATLPRSAALQPKSAIAGRSPHPATLPRASVAQPKSAATPHPAHAATLPRASAARWKPGPQATVQRSAVASSHSALFVRKDGRGKTGFLPIEPVPESCIEGAEFIIQCIASGKVLPWEVNKTRKPHVFAEFDSTSLNISTTVNVHNYFGGLKSYRFKGLPLVGEGLVIANTGKDAKGYNMHFGAVVARASDGSWCVVSNVSDLGKVQLVDKWELIYITNVSEFMSENGYTDPNYVLGWLHV